MNNPNLGSNDNGAPVQPTDPINPTTTPSDPTRPIDPNPPVGVPDRDERSGILGDNGISGDQAERDLEPDAQMSMDDESDLDRELGEDVPIVDEPSTGSLEDPIDVPMGMDVENLPAGENGVVDGRQDGVSSGTTVEDREHAAFPQDSGQISDEEQMRSSDPLMDRTI